MKTFKPGDTVWVRATYDRHLDGAFVHPNQILIGGWHACLSDDEIRPDTPEKYAFVDDPSVLTNLRQRAEKAEAEAERLRELAFRDVDRLHTAEAERDELKVKAEEQARSISNFHDECRWRDEHIGALEARVSQADADLSLYARKLAEAHEDLKAAGERAELEIAARLKAEAERDALKQENDSLSENLFITNKHACDLQATVTRVEVLIKAWPSSVPTCQLAQALNPDPLELLDRIEYNLASKSNIEQINRDFAELRKLLLEK